MFGGKAPGSGLERGSGCHSEPIRCAQGKLREGALRPSSQILRCAQDDRQYLQEGQGNISDGTHFIPGDQRAHILDVIGLRLSSIQAEVDWVARKIARLESEKE